ncbi:MAG TPA: hypothetical protein VEV82_06175 [Actinomycetota bacterium]|nr:hypothetical protein [Actinomycetota bacterium]
MAVAKGITYPLGTLEGELTGTWTYMLVSSHSLYWEDHASPEGVSQLDLDGIHSFSEGTQHHRYVVLLGHDPVPRLEQRSRSVFGIQWGNRQREGSSTETIFMFSRREAEAAQALGAQLSRRGIPSKDRLVLEERSGAERTRGSHVALTQRNAPRKK